MIDYIEANCIVPPLNSHPHYDEDSDSWDVWFEEKETTNSYGLSTAPICVTFDTLEEAQVAIRKAVQLYYENEEVTEEN